MREHYRMSLMDVQRPEIRTTDLAVESRYIIESNLQHRCGMNWFQRKRFMFLLHQRGQRIFWPDYPQPGQYSIKVVYYPAI